MAHSLDPIDFGQLVQQLALADDDGERVIAALAISAHRHLEGGRFAHPEHPEICAPTIGALLAAALCHPTPEHRAGEESRLEGLTTEALTDWCARAMDCYLEDGETAEEYESSHAQESAEAGARRLRTTAQVVLQRELQVDAVVQIGRYRIIAGLAGLEEAGLQPELLAAEVISAAFDSSVEDTLAALHSVLLAVMQRPLFRLGEVLGSLDPRAPLPNAIRDLISSLSVRPREARRLLVDGARADHTAQVRAFDLFSRRPLIQLGPDLFAAAPYAYVVHALSTYPYFRLRELAAEHDFGDGRKCPNNPLTRSMGPRFERYVNHFARKCTKRSIFFEEDVVGEWKRGAEVKSPDGLAVYGDRGVAVLFQSKLRPPHVDFWYGGRARSYGDLWWKPFGEMIRQNIAFLHFAMSDAALDPDRVRRPDIINAVRSTRFWYLFGITPIVPTLMMPSTVRKFLVPVVMERLAPAEADFFASNVESGRIKGIHADRIECLELISGRDSKPNIYKLFEEWVWDAERWQPSVAEPERIPFEFREFVRAGTRCRRPLGVVAAWETASSDMLDRFVRDAQ